jgi:hypothetical protein
VARCPCLRTASGGSGTPLLLFLLLLLLLLLLLPLSLRVRGQLGRKIPGPTSKRRQVESRLYERLLLAILDCKLVWRTTSTRTLQDPSSILSLCGDGWSMETHYLPRRSLRQLMIQREDVDSRVETPQSFHH